MDGGSEHTLLELLPIFNLVFDSDCLCVDRQSCTSDVSFDRDGLMVD